MQIDRRKVLDAFREYTDRYDPEDVKVKLKIDHTYRVASACERIAQSLELDPSCCDFAWLSGMLHDIGRFEQLRRFGTFQDQVSVNHAVLSADLLFKGDLIMDYAERDRIDFEMMDKVIRYHNALQLPGGLSETERLYCNILRDADKIDILRVNCETPRTEIYDLPESEFLNSAITQEVYEDICAERNVDRRNSKTGVDFILGHIAFIFGIVFKESFIMIREQGYLDRMLNFESKNTDTVGKLKIIREKIEDYMEKKL